ncbi:hypothetical protein [Niabella drilacis]|uniref:Outer membrane protein beta-barrel domain-containing protein n=1 Tax=Niabella drilacis (strain DSM 25811 / CCM 8410 / CCUG 62505 / LMG 26954 / E90) TaxID=1285928 RepID=A0A1G6LKY6_NIADE|nr:hypothetical protein [Niabella drilacis]SDC43903.1 hypothetical protein SAMN04487894_102385 [Niabella drilacis]
MKRLSILSFFILGVIVAQAQKESGAGAGNELRFSAGIHAGTQGFGMNAGYQVHRRWIIGLAASHAPYGYTTTRTLGKNEYNIKMKEKLSNIQAIAGWSPFGGVHSGGLWSRLYLDAGVAAFYNMEANATATPKNDYQYGDLIIKKEDLGKVDAHVQWKKIAPYAGLALHGLGLGNRFVFNANLGTYYLSKPEVHITADNLLSENTSQEGTAQKNLENYRWLPVVQAGVAYKF